jgi:hypothetical protein
MHPLIELSPAQTRQYIDAEVTLRALRDTQKAALEVRGSMFWREMGWGRTPQRLMPSTPVSWSAKPPLSSA